MDIQLSKLAKARPTYPAHIDSARTFVDNESSDAERSPFDPAPSAAKEPTDQRTRKKRSWLQSDAWNNAEQHSLVPDGSHWAVCGDLLARHDIEMVTAWKTGIQNQLIVSTLLSTISTAFVVQVQSDAAEQSTIALLSELVLQGNQSAILPPGIRQSAGTMLSSDTSHARVVNFLLYMSISLSVAAVTLGILCLQWMDALFGKAGMTNEAFCDVRHVRFEGFSKAARPIVESLPLLLLSSLVSFFAGLLFYLGIGDWVVAIPVYIILLAVTVVIIATTFWPAIVTLRAVLFPHLPTTFNPPFQSTQSWLFLRLVIWIVKTFSVFDSRGAELSLCKEWYQFDALWASWSPQRCTESLRLPLALATSNKDDMDALYHCFNEWKHIDTLLMNDTGTYGGRQLSVLRFLASQKADSLSSESTIREWETRFIQHFIRVLNDRGSISQMGPMVVESKLSLEKETPDTILQLLHSLLLYGDLENSETEINQNVWSMLWGALRAAIVHPRFDNTLLDNVVNDILDTVARTLDKRPSDEIFGPRFTTITNLRQTRDPNAGAIRASMPMLNSLWTIGMDHVVERFTTEVERIRCRNHLSGDGTRRLARPGSFVTEDPQTSGWNTPSREEETARLNGRNQRQYPLSDRTQSRWLGALTGRGGPRGRRAEDVP